ncbi:hypothetical protein [Candidatus Albibeggiatoa sp. nov. BB20]
MSSIHDLPHHLCHTLDIQIMEFESRSVDGEVNIWSKNPSS